MPITVKVNGKVNSLVHKGSSGISIATLPDVCKTPSPAGPVPIPYPNISQSATLSKGTTTVKADGGMMIAIKGSEFSLSNGDNAGVAGGVKSSTFMKASTWILYAPSVKIEGKGACRLADKKFQNNENTVDMQGVLEIPTVVVDWSKLADDPDAACKELDKKKVDNRHRPPDERDKAEHRKAAEDAGILPQDYDAMRRSASQSGAVVSVRDTNKACGKYLADPSYKSKPHAVDTKTENGLVPGHEKMTGDYDIHDVLDANKGGRISGGSVRENRIIDLINGRIRAAHGGTWPDRIMHGAQSNYYDYLKGHPDELAGKTPVSPKPVLLRPDKGLGEGKGMTVFDGAKPPNVYRLTSTEDVVNMYRCKETPLPEHWDIRDNRDGSRVVSSGPSFLLASGKKASSMVIDQLTGMLKAKVGL